MSHSPQALALINQAPGKIASRDIARYYATSGVRSPVAIRGHSYEETQQMSLIGGQPELADTKKFP